MTKQIVAVNGEELHAARLAQCAEETLALVRKLSEHVLKADPAVVRRRLPKRLRMIQCTQRGFEMLPGLVSRSEFQEWTGLSNEELLREVRAGRISTYKPSEHGYSLYYKNEIARLTGFKL